MIELVVMSIGLALLDSLNPATIGTMAVLLPLVKQVEHSLSFLISTYITYFAGALFLYYGIDQFLGKVFQEIVDQHPSLISIVELILGVILIGIGLWLYYKRRKRKEVGTSLTQGIGIRSLQPGYLFLFGIVSTLSDLPTALPLIGFIGRMVEFHPSSAILFLFLSLYVLLYVAPLIALYVVFKNVKEKLEVVTEWFHQAIVHFSQYALPPLMLVLGGWIMVIGVMGLR